MEIPHWLRFERGLWRLNVGSCVGLKPQRKGDVSVCVFATIKTQDARAVRLLSVIDKHTRQCQAILTSGVIETVAELMVSPGVPHIRSDNGLEFTAMAVRWWCAEMGARTPGIEPGPPRKNGYVERRFNGKPGLAPASHRHPQYRDNPADGGG